MNVRVIHGDARTALRELPDASVHCVVTSPPYYGLRDYGVAGQIGLEETAEAYVEQLVAVFREVRRVLRPDGTCWLNLGDSYAGSWGAQGRPDDATACAGLSAFQIAAHPRKASHTGSIKMAGVKAKDLYGIPWMVAFALRADGWWLRRDVIWSKGNPMPESVTDRPAGSHEYVFLLTKRESYFYDGWQIREAVSGTAYARGTGVNPKSLAVGFKVKQNASFSSVVTGLVASRNARSVWEINSERCEVAHFATMPSTLAEKCILAGTSEFGCCAACGAPWERIVGKGDADIDRQRAAGGDAAGEYHGQSRKGHDAAGVQDASDVKRRILAGMVEKFTAGWQMTCRCRLARPVPCTVADPFGGAGTTALAADRLSRHAVIVELNPDYVDMASSRIASDARMFASVAVSKERELENHDDTVRIQQNQ